VGEVHLIVQDLEQLDFGLEDEPLDLFDARFVLFDRVRTRPLHNILSEQVVQEVVIDELVRADLARRVGGGPDFVFPQIFLVFIVLGSYAEGIDGHRDDFVPIVSKVLLLEATQVNIEDLGEERQSGGLQLGEGGETGHLVEGFLD
jgi:hypothetical protein